MYFVPVSCPFLTHCPLPRISASATTVRAAALVLDDSGGDAKLALTLLGALGLDDNPRTRAHQEPCISGHRPDVSPRRGAKCTVKPAEFGAASGRTALGPGDRSCGTARARGKRETRAATDRVQFSRGHTPTVRASHGQKNGTALKGGQVRVPRVRSQARVPGWRTEHAARTGGSEWRVAQGGTAKAVGVLNVYNTRESLCAPQL